MFSSHVCRRHKGQSSCDRPNHVLFNFYCFYFENRKVVKNNDKKERKIESMVTYKTNFYWVCWTNSKFFYRYASELWIREFFVLFFLKYNIIKKILSFICTRCWYNIVLFFELKYFLMTFHVFFFKCWFFRGKNCKKKKDKTWHKNIEMIYVLGVV